MVLLRFDLTRDSAAAFDLDLAIADGPGDLTGGAHEQSFLHDELTFEAAMHIGVIGRDIASEDAGLRDDDLLAAIQFCVDRAFRNQPIARGDRARHRHSGTDDKRSSFDLAVARTRIRLGLTLRRKRIAGTRRFARFPKRLRRLQLTFFTSPDHDTAPFTTAINWADLPIVRVNAALNAAPRPKLSQRTRTGVYR